MSITPIAANRSEEELMSRVGAFSGSYIKKMRSYNCAAGAPTCEALDINSSERRISREGVMRRSRKGSFIAIHDHWLSTIARGFNLQFTLNQYSPAAPREFLIVMRWPIVLQRFQNHLVFGRLLWCQLVIQSD